jgi:hypothetical protein
VSPCVFPRSFSLRHRRWRFYTHLSLKPFETVRQPPTAPPLWRASRCLLQYPALCPIALSISLICKLRSRTTSFVISSYPPQAKSPLMSSHWQSYVDTCFIDPVTYGVPNSLPTILLHRPPPLIISYPSRVIDPNEFSLGVSLRTENHPRRCTSLVQHPSTTLFENVLGMLARNLWKMRDGRNA